MNHSRNSIAVVDISGLVAPDRAAETDAAVLNIVTAFRDTGFLCVTGTGVPPALIADMRRVVRAVFDLPEADKQAQSITKSNYRGYIPFGFFTPNDGSGKADNYEGYKLHTETAADDPIRADCALYGPNLWPDHVPEAKQVVLQYWQAMDDLTRILLQAIAVGLNIPPEKMLQPMRSPMTGMTLLHYPPQTEGDTGFGIHPHKDTDLLTIISPDPVGGLEVQTRDNGWISVACPSDGFVVNIGDMLELWSGGHLLSTPHRVVNRSGKQRYSFPYFAVPRHDVTLTPLVEPVLGFAKPNVNCGHWSAEIWRTNWPDETVHDDTPALGTLPG